MARARSIVSPDVVSDAVLGAVVAFSCVASVDAFVLSIGASAALVLRIVFTARSLHDVALLLASSSRSR